jgi:YCII-related domain
MATFVFSYRMPAAYIFGRPETVAAWTAWFEDIEASVADTGKPVLESAALGDCGRGTRLGGYSLIDADDLDAALALAKGCPSLQHGGGIEVGVLGEISRGGQPAEPA